MELPHTDVKISPMDIFLVIPPFLIFFELSDLIHQTSLKPTYALFNFNNKKVGKRPTA